MSKQDLVDALLKEIMKEVSLKVREIIREEIEIETKRFRKKLLREVNSLLLEHRSVKPTLHKTTSANQTLHKLAKKIETGDSSVDELLQETEGDPAMLSSMNFGSAANTFQQVVTQINEERKKPSNGHSDVWKPPPGEAIDFNPITMDPSMIDWSEVVEKTDERAKKSSGPL